MVLDEIYIISKNTNNSFKDVEMLPIYKRRYYIHKLKEDFDRMNAEYEKAKNR